MASVALSPGCPSGLAPPSTNDAPRANPAAFVREGAGGEDTLELMVQGASCAKCIRKIETALHATSGVTFARLNLSTGRLAVRWRHGALAPQTLVDAVAGLGYGVSAFDATAHEEQVDKEGRFLLRAIAVSGFAMMNIMMFSVPIWSGDTEMGDATRTMLHWVSAIIAVPAALYAGQPFFRSAFAALRRGQANMDVPISLGVLLALTLSLYETAVRGAHAYFDGACMLLFLLLIGRYLDHRLRQRARSAARDLLALQATSATRLMANGAAVAVSPRELEIDDRVLIAPGDRVPVDGVVLDGASEIDFSMLTGETAPHAIAPGDALAAGAINLTRALTMRVTKREEDSAVAALSRLIEAGEQGRAQFVRIADKAARLYVPVVHSLAALTFLGWLFGPALLRLAGVAVADPGLHRAALNAISVLIITCPCALGLAVPAVHIVATGRLFRRGVFIKSGDALERLAQIDYVLIDKTGTLTLGRPRLVTALPAEVLTAAASLARTSRHPLSRALVAAAGPGALAAECEEVVGEGIVGTVDGQIARLGRRTFAAPNACEDAQGGPELWFAWGDATPIRLQFEDALRADAALAVAAFKQRGIPVELMSGDRDTAVQTAAREAGIALWRANAKPQDKTDRLAELHQQGRRVLMVGDGLNDAAALAAAHASASPGSAVEVSQAASDIVIQGDRLDVLVEAIDEARVARVRVFQNLWFSALYNFVAVPVAVAGFVTPLIAALAMSGSSIAVTLNALRPSGRTPWT